MKILLLVNPCAGQKKAKKHLAEIIDVFNRAGDTVIVHITAGQGDGVEAVIRYAGEVDRVVCCGGDGTFNETVSGVLKSGKDLPIGYIPTGSTNDFAASLQLCTEPLQAAEAAVQGRPRQLDVGLFGDRYFSYVASFGAFTRTSYTTPQGMKNVLGHAAYVLSGIQELSQLRPCRMCFTLPDGSRIEDDFLFGAISNTTSVGGILTLDKQRVDMADGLLELLLIRAPGDLTELSECVRCLQQKTYDCRMISFLSTASVTVTAPENVDWTVDGEQAKGGAHVEVKCLHKAVSVIAD